MTYTRKNKGVCSTQTTVTLQNGIITDIHVDNGCDGNLVGLRALLLGSDAASAAQKLAGLRCGAKSTSCPDQIAQCIQEALAQETA